MKTEDITKEVWKIVKKHNNAWSELEDTNEQLKYVHNDIVFIKPPFKGIIKGKEKYKANYEKWLRHAKVDSFKEVNPIINIFDHGNFAIVTFSIEMSFTYDDRVESNWRGSDMMTLVKESRKWLITSVMYARRV